MQEYMYACVYIYILDAFLAPLGIYYLRVESCRVGILGRDTRHVWIGAISTMQNYFIIIDIYIYIYILCLCMECLFWTF